MEQQNENATHIVWQCASCSSTVIVPTDNPVLQCFRCDGNCNAVDMISGGKQDIDIRVDTSSCTYQVLCTLGYVNYLEHEGALVYYNAGWQMDVIVTPFEGDPTWTVYTVALDRLEYGASEWFLSHLKGVEESYGRPDGSLLRDLVSDNPFARAEAYRDIGSVEGFINFDSSPMHLSACKVYARYGRELDSPCLCSKCVAAAKHRGKCPKCLGEDFETVSYHVVGGTPVDLEFDTDGLAVDFSLDRAEGDIEEMQVVCLGCDHEFDLASIMKP